MNIRTRVFYKTTTVHKHIGNMVTVCLLQGIACNESAADAAALAGDGRLRRSAAGRAAARARRYVITPLPRC